MTSDFTERTTKIRAGLVGLGTVASYHIAVLRKTRGVHLVGGCDPDAGKRNYVRKRWKLEKIYATQDELMEKERLDAVHVLTPPPSHLPIALQCLERPCHCLIEKPLAISVEEADLLAHAAAKNRRIAGVNHNKIWNAAFRKLTRLISERKLGEIKHVTVEHAVERAFRKGDWALEDPSFPVLETASHTFSLVSDLLGGIRETRSRICQVMQVGERAMVTSWQSSLACERGNALAFISLRGSLPCCTVSVLGTEGAAQADLLSNTLTQSGRFGRYEPYERVLRTATGGMSRLGQGLRSAGAYAAHRAGFGVFGDPFLESMRRSIGEFYQAIREHRQPKADLEAGREAVRACELVAADLGSGLEAEITRDPMAMGTRVVCDRNREFI